MQSLQRFFPDGLLCDVAGHLPRDGVQKRLNILRFAFSHQLYLATGKVSDIAGYRKTLRQALAGVAKAHALHTALVMYQPANHWKITSSMLLRHWPGFGSPR